MGFFPFVNIIEYTSRLLQAFDPVTMRGQTIAVVVMVLKLSAFQPVQCAFQNSFLIQSTYRLPISFHFQLYLPGEAVIIFVALPYILCTLKTFAATFFLFLLYPYYCYFSFSYIIVFRYFSNPSGE